MHTRPTWFEQVQERRRCKKCQFEFVGSDEITIGFDRFIPNKNRLRRRSSQPVSYYRSTCNLCLLDRRAANTDQEPWIHKARRTLRRHAHRLGLTAIDFARRYDWAAERIAHDFEHAFENRCGYCQ